MNSKLIMVCKGSWCTGIDIKKLQYLTLCALSVDVNDHLTTLIILTIEMIDIKRLLSLMNTSLCKHINLRLNYNDISGPTLQF